MSLKAFGIREACSKGMKRMWVMNLVSWMGTWGVMGRATFGMADGLGLESWELQYLARKGCLQSLLGMYRTSMRCACSLSAHPLRSPYLPYFRVFRPAAKACPAPSLGHSAASLRVGYRSHPRGSGNRKRTPGDPAAQKRVSP